MTRYFLETSFIIPYLRGNKESVVFLDTLEGELTSSFVCLAELYEGVARVKESKTVEQGVLNFFRGLSEVYGIDETVARHFGFLRAHLKKRGEILEDLDILIAATCLTFNATLVTTNVRHFQRIHGLSLRAYP